MSRSKLEIISKLVETQTLSATSTFSNLHIERISRSIRLICHESVFILFMYICVRSESFRPAPHFCSYFCFSINIQIRFTSCN